MVSHSVPADSETKTFATLEGMTCIIRRAAALIPCYIFMQTLKRGKRNMKCAPIHGLFKAVAKKI